VFTFYPKSLQKYFPEYQVEMADIVDFWRYQVIKYTWKSPGKIHIEFVLARNMGKDMVAKILEKGPGTRMVYGYKPKPKMPEDNIYVKLAPSGDPTLDKSIERTIYIIKPESEKYSSGLLRLDYSGTLLDLLAKRENYFRTGTVEMKVGKLKYKKDFRVANGEAMFKEASAPGDYYIITMKPNNIDANRGIEKEVMYINKETLVPAQLEIYHEGKIVACLTVTDVKIDQGVSDELWGKFFKGAVIVPPRK